MNGRDQYLRIGDTKADMSLGNVVSVRYMRAFAFWVYFDEFTNNAHIFDFGDGPRKSNIWAGILGRGGGQTDGRQRGG
ncbi:hypothetical protein, partial [Enterococcus faecalis]|uniref:hypothetical protein n=1 Tax=Enterococcus faecalis TaxID=1351 RepID=UPI0021D56B0E